MTRLSRKILLENDLSPIVSAFFLSFNINALLKKIGAYKTKGIPAVVVYNEPNRSLSVFISHAMRKFMRVSFSDEQAPHVATLLKFRHLIM